MLKFGLPSINLIYSEINNQRNFSKTKIENSNEKKITFYKSSSIKKRFFFIWRKNYFEKANIIIEKGKTNGVYGRTGSGKSTLIDLLSGLIKPTEGDILSDNFNTNNLKSWKNKISYVSQNIYLIDDSIENNIIF